MKIITDIQQMQQLCLAARRQGQRISFVPTMGFLHEGHLSLLRAGRERGELLVLSIFVNPTQFGVGEDFESYPRDLSRDAAMAESVGVDLLFAPEARDMYPKGYASYVNVEGLTETLCGASRPGHFRGVTTVVAKLFGIVQPDVALFGRKDFQQLAVIQRMTQDLNLPVEVLGMPIIREADGLAMSSRNSYLSPAERRQALSLSEAIALACRMVAQGEADAGKILQAVRRRIETEPDAVIDYLKICHGRTLEEMAQVTVDSVILLAVKIGKTRLIDNQYLIEEA
ncbi:pantothenate synthetase [Desulfuromonas versatilis]|uniref:Pantothenate synthetase n=1 Tax=Desulfuromonas versatilis TaxID=2802975 RepID=A0ABM8HXL2_9BACT|nr:pantoate--beta-alanine ligase [Desulfuromonas versatilis]BCR05326.1 pantothenate synthetase [Desulfuromonas versatilis]